jgi:uncharacterized repeat protein (TIGR01451 family)
MQCIDALQIDKYSFIKQLSSILRIVDEEYSVRWPDGENAMKRLPFVLLAMFILIAGIGVVSADNLIQLPFDITKTHDVNPVKAGDVFTYTIKVTNPYNLWFNSGLITDKLPDAVDFVSCDSGCEFDAPSWVLWEGITQQSTAPYAVFERKITVKLKPGMEGKTFCNHIDANMGMTDDKTTQGYGSADDCITVPDGSVAAPEFPSLFLPVTVIAALFMTVLYIRKSRY